MTEFLGLKLNSPMALAPLAGISDSAFRRIVRAHGAALSCTEMVSAKGLYYKSPGTEDLLAIDPSEGPVGIQIFGSEPDMIAFAADKLKDRPNVFLDINMGCPVPKVVKNGEGSAMLLDPDNAARCVEAAAEHSGGKPVTIKMRVGFCGKPDTGPAASDADPSAGAGWRNSYDYVGFAKLMERAGASAVAVHGRTRDQYYSGKADWNSVAEIAAALSIPVAGNGDVSSAQDARDMIQRTGCRIVLIGRGALGDPWIFEEWEDPAAGKRFRTAEEISAEMLKHFKLLRQLKGERTAVMEMRKHFGWYTKGVRGAAELRRQVNTALSAEQMINYINDASVLTAGVQR